MKKTINTIRRNFWPLLVFGVFFLAVPVSQLGLDSHLLFKMMPGDLGDARLNNYFLENIYQFLLGNSESLWHLGFFWPFPYVLGFSDNLFGAAPIYLVARFLSGQTDTAFQIWFVAGYAVNFWAAYHTLNKLGISQLAACVGATIFAFALPVTAHAGHAQLHFRFGVPFALLYLVQFLERRQLWMLTTAFAWLVWQFYCGVYVGFFTALLLFATFIGFIFKSNNSLWGALYEFFRDLRQSWNENDGRHKLFLIIAWIGLLLLLVLLFYPYLQASRAYGIKRGWGEISTMLPRPQSYFIADTSWFWAQPAAKLFAIVPMRHEHQMFPGVVSFSLLIAAIFCGARTSDTAGRSFSLMVFSLGLLLISTLYIGGFSLWFFIHWLPLASAIRAMTRIDLVMLLPLAFAVAYFLDQVRVNKKWGSVFIILIVFPALLMELSSSSMYVSSKIEWRQRLEAKLGQAPINLTKDSVLFFAAPNEDGPYKAEIDAMLVSQKLGMKSMNGYSGSEPREPGYGGNYGTNCAVLPQRISSYVRFSKEKLEYLHSYQQLMGNVTPVGFLRCKSEWWVKPPEITSANKPYSKHEFSKISFVTGNLENIYEDYFVSFGLKNSNDKSISARSAVGKPIRISWRYLDRNCKPFNEWSERMDISEDIFPNEILKMSILLDKNQIKNSCGMQVTLVQELEFWGHDVGITPLLIKFNNK
jgi:hypothetical protein